MSHHSISTVFALIILLGWRNESNTDLNLWFGNIQVLGLDRRRSLFIEELENDVRLERRKINKDDVRLDLVGQLSNTSSSTLLVYTVSVPHSIRPGSPALRLPPSGREHRCPRWSRTRPFSQLCPAQTCTGSCCLARPQTRPPAQSSGYAAWRRSEEKKAEIKAYPRLFIEHYFFKIRDKIPFFLRKWAWMWKLISHVFSSTRVNTKRKKKKGRGLQGIHRWEFKHTQLSIDSRSKCWLNYRLLFIFCWGWLHGGGPWMRSSEQRFLNTASIKCASVS